MAKKEDVVAMAAKLMGNRQNIRNLGIVAHIDHGKTTMTDSLVASSGLISEELAGKQLFMDHYELEQERGITINAANISITHNYNNQEYLINIIDTPGHIDFGGDVIRAMRAVDGVIVVVDAVEGVMPQTETVIRQALKEYVKPVLFINKVDRLINELQVTQEEMQQRFVKTIAGVTNLIKKNIPKEFGNEWIPNVENGSVVFGSGYYKWAISVPQMKKKNISFKDIYDHLKQEKQKELSKKIPLAEPMLEMVINHLPNPLTAQKYRTQAIWKGDIESEVGKAMMTCDPNGPFSMMVTDVSVDQHAGDVATGRIYSGTLRKGSRVKLIGGQKEAVIQQVGVFMGPERVPMDEVSAGNIAALVGLRDVYTGETLSSVDMSEFESFKSTTEPVITISVEAKHTKDLPKLIEVLRQITKEDPNVIASLNQETGEHLISGMGELHLEVTQHRISHDHKVEINVGNPIVVYRETINNESDILEGKSPNKHNKLKMYVERLPDEIIEKLKDTKLEGKLKAKDKEVVAKLEEAGFGRDEAKKVWAIHNNCVLVDMTRGIQALHEIKELVIEGFIDAMKQGPLAKEKCFGVKVILDDAKLHEDAIHRGPAQILPVMTRTIYACMLSADPVLLEPKQILTLSVPEDNLGSASKELSSRRTQINEMRTEGDSNIIIAKVPVKEMIGFSQSIRGATQGRALWTAEYAGYEELPRELQHNVVTEVRKRKGMDPTVKPYHFFLE
ncbi:MAG: elongation factor EF-2 [Candidatus Diapherotrites archaeon]